MQEIPAAHKALLSKQHMDELRVELLAKQRDRQRFCRHRYTYFSWVLCGCGAMHTTCRDCDAVIGQPCEEETP